MNASRVPRVVLVTGVARFLGAHLAARLAADRGIERVIGVDFGVPEADLAAVLDGIEVYRLDPRSPGVTKLLVDAQVEAVAHLAVSATPDPSAGGRAVLKELNVIGTMQLLAACQQAPTLTKLVVRSSTAAYGASFRDPAVFTEDTEPREVPRGGFARDVFEVEGYVRGFRRRRPAVAATVLRFAPSLGPHAGTRMTRYFAQPVIPTVLGRDPRLQFVHIDDAFEVLHRAVAGWHPGTFNVAGDGTITLSQAVRRAGRIAVPVPERALTSGISVARGTRAVGITLDQLDLFVHGRVVDTSRLAAEFGFQPRSTAAALDDFVRANADGAVYGPEQVRVAEKLILERIRQVRQARPGRQARQAMRARPGDGGGS